MAEGTEYADGYNMEDWDFDEVMVETGVRGYLYEPQYSDEQLRAMEEQEAAEAAAATAEAGDLPAADEEPAMARARADWWYLCSHVRQWTQNKSLSAAENSSGANFFWTKSRNRRTTRTCVLSITRVSHPIWIAASWRPTLEYLRQFRLTAYRHFLEWVLQGERLGRGRRVVLPACVMQAIRQRYPAPDGQYCGHQEAEDAQDDL
ncbi:hypothetical protein N1851_002425 [Merluccius polli]|uniref:P2X purinoreceptor 7 intracellular domain-containing protein n=1 Tax=Merluccius polli TaxID=89951 RepID=A0AA47M2N5_MERPO|nr:hypothetical protein N1851_032651 [Merluccius polli]KAK0152651.1 hypothetical protein N1851_005823 [Merluccius polli]KAK0155234.1 hypothetical protein N1851_002425 [Merluccius polli]